MSAIRQNRTVRKTTVQAEKREREYAARNYQNSIFRELLPYKVNFDRILGGNEDRS